MFPTLATNAEMLFASRALSVGVIRDALKAWGVPFSPKERRRIEHDSRAMGLAWFIAADEIRNGWSHDADWQDSLAALQFNQARLLLRARICQLTSRFDMAVTLLHRASIYPKSRKPLLRARDAILTKWAAEDAAIAEGARPLAYQNRVLEAT